MMTHEQEEIKEAVEQHHLYPTQPQWLDKHPGMGLWEADLRWATLWGADLHKAGFRGVDMTRVDLINAGLWEDMLRWCDLSGAISSDIKSLVKQKGKGRKVMNE